MSDKNTKGISRSIESIRSLLRIAYSEVMDDYHDMHEWPEHVDDIVGWNIKTAYERSLILLEQIGLQETYYRLRELYDEAKSRGFSEKKEDPYGEPYLEWDSPLRSILDSISDFHVINEAETEFSRDLISIIEHATYSITNTKTYSSVPKNENDVHLRLEGILRCIFPDLKRKPTLTKPIKNFEPDTGIPSLKTLLEYKYISNEAEAKRVVDEVLADTRGYVSPDWNNFLFVIYETHRVKPESEWNQLIKSCDISHNIKAVVLHGEATASSITKKDK